MIIFALIFFVSHNFSAFETKGTSDSQYQNNNSGRLLKYKNLQVKIKLIKDECGNLCDMSKATCTTVSKDDKSFYVAIQKQVDCNRLWNNSIFDEKSEFDEAVQIIPKYLQETFSHNGMVDIKLDYYDELKDNLWNQTFNKWGKNISGKNLKSLSCYICLNF